MQRQFPFQAAGRGLFQYLRPQERNQNALINQHVPQLGKSCPKRIITRSGQGIRLHGKTVQMAQPFMKKKEMIHAEQPRLFIINAAHQSLRQPGNPSQRGIPQAPFIPFTGGGSPFLPMLQAFQQKSGGRQGFVPLLRFRQGPLRIHHGDPPVRKTGKLARTVQGGHSGTGRRIQGQRIVHNQAAAIPGSQTVHAFLFDSEVIGVQKVFPLFQFRQFLRFQAFVNAVSNHGNAKPFHRFHHRPACIQGNADTAHIPQAAQDIFQSASAGIHGYTPAGMPLREIAVLRQFQPEKTAYARPPFHTPCHTTSPL